MDIYAHIEDVLNECGFDDFGHCPARLLRVRPEVREMCAAGRCQKFGHSWACPPACGTLESFQELFGRYTTCYAVQTVGALEDGFDFEGMLAVERLQKSRVAHLVEGIAERDGDALVLSSGTCTLCETCTYPDAPCRFPDRRLVSMEAAGLVVTEVCESCGIPYNHGERTIAYTGCMLI